MKTDLQILREAMHKAVSMCELDSEVRLFVHRLDKYICQINYQETLKEQRNHSQSMEDALGPHGQG